MNQFRPKADPPLAETINVIYFGTPTFSAEILESLILELRSDISVVAVVTNPDQKVGRAQVLTPSPVAQTAAQHHLPVFKPATLDDDNLAHLKLLKPDIFLTVAYGKIIPDSWLSTPRIAPLNLHFSLLPQYRGALCLQEALKNGDRQTGVTLMIMDNQLDHGPIISRQSVEIDEADDVASLQTKLTQVAKELLARDLPRYLKDEVTPQPQDESQATYTPSLKTLTRQNAFIPWEQIKKSLTSATAGSVPLGYENLHLTSNTHHLIRSLNPEPGAWTRIRVKDQGNRIKEIELKILKTSINKSLSLKPESLNLDLVQKPGKSPISWSTYLAGHRVL